MLMDLYSMMLNINNKDLESIIKESINKTRKEINFSEGMCKVAANLVYNDLKNEHVVAKIVNTKELGLGYEHEFVLVKDVFIYYLIDVTYEQFINKGTKLNEELLKNGYIHANDKVLGSYLNSIPNTYKLDSINIDDIFYESKAKKR